MKPDLGLVTALLSAAVLVTTAAPFVLAQQSSLVIVDIKPIAAEIARNANVEASEIPLTVQAPVDVAAKACGVSANVLREQAGQGGVSCAATTTSPALERLVQVRRREQ